MRLILFLLFYSVFSYSQIYSKEDLKFWEENMLLEKLNILEVTKDTIDISKIYPFSRADKIEVVAFYKKDFDTEIILKGVLPKISKENISERKFLTEKQIYSLAQALRCTWAKNCNDNLNCYEPKHLIIFYNNNKPFSYLEFSVECLEMQSKDNKNGIFNFCSKNVEVFSDILIDAEINTNPIYYKSLIIKTKNNKIGFVNKNNDLLINYQYEVDKNNIIGDYIEYSVSQEDNSIFAQFNKDSSSINSFQFNLYPAFSNSKYCYINADNEIVIPFKFDKADVFYKGKEGIYAIVKIGDKYGLINEKGEYNLNPNFISIKICKNLSFEREKYLEESLIYEVEKDGKVFKINEEGERIDFINYGEGRIRVERLY